MRRWMLAATHGDPLTSLASVEIQTFTSGDGDEPVDGDLHAAAVELYGRLRERREVLLKDLEVVLIPLEEAKGLTIHVEPTASIVATGSI